MKILSIETSCDETSVALIEATGGVDEPVFSVVDHITASQIDIHKEFGGVFPMMAKREHIKTLPLLLEKILTHTTKTQKEISKEEKETVATILTREPEMLDEVLALIAQKPDIDAIAVTYGPGLEPALWVGVNTAKALAFVWNIPLIPVNHMEGHLLSTLVQKNGDAIINVAVTLPAIVLLVSGGHTELIHVKSWGDYTKLGYTKDDAAGEAFDKVARMLDLPYPGGPKIAQLAARARMNTSPQPSPKLGEGAKAEKVTFPRPMMRTDDYLFSFSGLKTAVLYHVRDNPIQSEQEKEMIACEFEDAVFDVLVHKTMRAIDEFGAQTLIVGGGVAASTELRKRLQEKTDELGVNLHFPSSELATDNALMIAIAGYFTFVRNNTLTGDEILTLKAQGNLSL
jgi:N6-L-threonylcarbamoyladenine synthase